MNRKHCFRYMEFVGTKVMVLTFLLLLPHIMFFSTNFYWMERMYLRFKLWHVADYERRSVWMLSQQTTRDLWPLSIRFWRRKLAARIQNKTVEWRDKICICTSGGLLQLTLFSSIHSSSKEQSSPLSFPSYGMAQLFYVPQRKHEREYIEGHKARSLSKHVQPSILPNIHVLERPV